ncbi:MAG: hypothetical protein ACXV8L_11275 [Ilumatobacteraceae bacterium]
MSTRTRRRFDDDDFEPPAVRAARHATTETDESDDGITYSTYADALHGPMPAPDWVITSPAAIDVDLGVFKTGKEADVSLVRRTHNDRSVLLAAKEYRDAHHRMFHRDVGYLEGRRMRRSRENRAIDTRTEFGRELIAGSMVGRRVQRAVTALVGRRGGPLPGATHRHPTDHGVHRR